MKKTVVLALLTLVPSAYALEKYQGDDYEVKYESCGAPLVQALRKSDPEKLLNDPDAKLKLKASLERISEENIERVEKELGTLSAKEEELLKLIQNKYYPPIVHRTSVETAKILLPKEWGLVSATKRKAPPAHTPSVEEKLYSAADCVFTAVAPPYGIDDYGTVLLRFKDRNGFAWGTVLTGWTWVKDVLKKPLTDASDDMKRKFAEMVYTNNHWEKAIAYQIIGHIRAGASIRGLGKPYDKKTILDTLLTKTRSSDFWGTVAYHRLGFLEGHYSDNVELKQMSFIQFREDDRKEVNSWNLKSDWFEADPYAFIQFFDRTK
ncbi:MAG: hypothetical protein ACOYL6_08550 [Bacteriovoracaceae bacterium]